MPYPNEITMIHANNVTIQTTFRKVSELQYSNFTIKKMYAII